jgi:quercetin dioxygenase-like cupin family protein
MTDDTSPAASFGGPGRSEERWMGDTCTRFLATGETTGGQFCLVDETAQRGEAIPLHRHPQDVESFYVVSGDIAFFLGDGPGFRAGPGDFLHVPPGAVHGFRIVSDSARYLILTTPRHGEFYRAISVPAAAGGGPPGGEVDWDRIMEIAEDHGIEVVGDLPDDP